MAAVPLLGAVESEVAAAFGPFVVLLGQDGADEAAFAEPVGPLRFELAGKRRARRGNYRVIYEIFETVSAVQVEVIAVQHRADA